MPKKLTEYAHKRNFKKTPEPKPHITEGNKQPLFVIQKHHASHLHYDLRLEIEGVLTSWAVPKGPSTDPRDKRLAMLTEDHPLAYATFEGIIPQGYGAGTVIVWDTGTYSNKTMQHEKPLTMAEGLTEGHLHITLHGHKLQGDYTLTQFRAKERAWLLIKVHDEYADARRNPVGTEPQSVLSEYTIEHLDREFKKKPS